MKRIEQYLDVLKRISLNLNKKDELFIVLPADAEENEWAIEKFAGPKAKICFDKDMFEKENLPTAIEKKSKMILFVTDNQNSKYLQFLDDIINAGIDIDYVIAIMPNDCNITYDEFTIITNMKEENSFIDWRKINSANFKKALQLKNLKIESIKLKKGINEVLTFNTNGQFEGGTNYNKMTLFPDYSIKMYSSGDAHGYIEATDKVMIGDKAIEDLRLYFDRGILCDYECSSAFDIAKDLFGPKAITNLHCLGLTEKLDPTYSLYKRRNNYVLDKIGSPYLILISKNIQEDENKFIYVPIASGTLKVVGTNINNENIPLYENEEFTAKVNTKKNN